MSLEGKAITEYASLSGKIHTLVIDKTLSISGAAADAKAVGEKIDTFDKKVDEANKSVEQAKKDYEEAVADMDEAAAEAANKAVDGAMATILSNRTKALFGLNANAIPDEAFAFLGKYNQHWWSRTAQNLVTKYRYRQTQEGGQITFYFSKILCSDAVTMNEDTGELALVNPIVPASYSEFKSHPYCKSTGQGVYINAAGATSYNETDVFYCPNNPSHSASNLVRFDSNVPVYKLVVESYQINVGDTEFVHSSNRNAYPDSGISGGFEYAYLGIPFDNSVNPLRAVTGTYAGGASNPEIVVGFRPQFLLITRQTGTNQSVNIMLVIGNSYQMRNITLGGSLGTGGATITDVGFKVTSNTTSATGMNYSGDTYYYTAIG